MQKSPKPLMYNLEFSPQVTDRLIPLEGCHNFRHVSGWRSRDGKTMVEGRVFRSDGLEHLSDADHSTLTKLGITHVFDLRGDAEMSRAPSRWPAGFEAVVWTGAQSAAEADLMSLMARETQSAQNYADAMRHVYRNFPMDLAPAVSAVLATLATNPESRVLIHCAAGKDRTGFVTAMLLHAIGIVREDVVKDFLLSNASAAKAHVKFDNDGRLSLVESRAPGALINLVGVHRAYLKASFDAIEQSHQSVDNWLARHIGFEVSTRATLRSHLLE